MPAIPSGLTSSERTKVCQLLAMTASDNDGEALNAIRAANRILKAKEVHWLEFLGDGSSAEPASERPSKPPHDASKAQSTRNRTVNDDIDDAFEAILSSDCSASFRDTIESIMEQWEKTGRLSERQHEVVMKGAERARRWK